MPVKIEKISQVAVKKLISELKDDLGSINLKNDITSKILLPNSLVGKAVITNREKIILCGQDFLKDFLKQRFPMLAFKSKYTDGNELNENSTILEIKGNIKFILLIERTILNFVQHLSSISTYTRKFVKKIQGTKTKLLDTRKTTTGLRVLEKYATKIGGAHNHRQGLFDQLLIKDNHIKLLGGIDNTLKIIKQKSIKKYIIECDSFLQVKKCLKFGSNYILLDNMRPNEIKKCIHLKKKIKRKVLFEISGGINFENISLYSNLGSDFISSSKITNSAKSVDIGLDII
ncbi:MAG: nicotinate-nucleotide diphosphorylase (carboxylating) [Rickettsiales bacterium]|nr:nicotinate-nucleotide diphosphorylase (carboxylating) [Rickettsiales bacterium]